MLLSQMEIDLERKELDVRREIFELQMRHILLAHLINKQENSLPLKRVDLDEFKNIYERDFDQLESHMKDEVVHALFKELKASVNEALRGLNKVENQVQLKALRTRVEGELPMINFTQVFTDVEASI
jgi:hypothetical protein